MRFYIGFLPDSQFIAQYERIITDISALFGLTDLAKKARTPHITIKSPGEIEDIFPVERMLSYYEFSASDLMTSIGDVDVFNEGEEVIHFPVENPRIQELAGIVLRDLRKLELPGVTWGRYDSSDKLMHITIAKRSEIKNKGDEVLDYLRSQRFSLPLRLESLAIFRKENGRTSIHSSYPFL